MSTSLAAVVEPEEGSIFGFMAAGLPLCDGLSCSKDGDGRESPSLGIGRRPRPFLPAALRMPRREDLVGIVEARGELKVGLKRWGTVKPILMSCQ